MQLDSYGVFSVSKITRGNKTYEVGCKTYEVGRKTYEVGCKTYEVGHKTYEPGCTKNYGVGLKKNMRSVAEQSRLVSTIMRLVAPKILCGCGSKQIGTEVMLLWLSLSSGHGLLC